MVTIVRHSAVARAVALVLVTLSGAAANPSAVRAAQIDRDIVYGHAGGEKLLLDVYRPAEDASAGDQKRVAVLLIHGGGWRGGDRTAPSMVALANALADAGFVAFSVEYRLVKPAADGAGWLNQYPAAIDDCRRAVRWVRRHAADYNIDPARIGAAGDSAGGHLVALLGTTDARDSEGATSSRVQAVVDIFGPIDLSADFSHMQVGDVNVQDIVDAFIAAPEQKHEASPLFHIDDRTAAFLVFHGADDPLVPVQQSRDFHAALQKAGRTSQYVEFPSAGHGFAGQQWDELVAKSIAFFRAELGAAAPAGDVSVDDPPAEDQPVDLLALFKMHYANRVRSFQEQNLVYQNIVLLGDSITEGFDVTKYFPGRRVLNRGIGGDVIGNALPGDDPRGVLRRLDESVFDCAATDVFLMIGVNDLGSGRTPEVMEQGYREILVRLRDQAPAVRVHIESVLPTRDRYAKHNEPVRDFNARLKRLAQEFHHDFIDLHVRMADECGELKSEFTADGLHLLPPAYDLWRTEVDEALGW